MCSVLSVCNQLLSSLHSVFLFYSSYFEISLPSLLLAHSLVYGILKWFMVCMYCMHSVLFSYIIFFFFLLLFLSAKQRQLNLDVNFMGEREGKEEVEGQGAANCFAKSLWARAMLLFENIDICPGTATVKNNMMVITYEKAYVIGHVTINEKLLWLLSALLQHVWFMLSQSTVCGMRETSPQRLICMCSSLPRKLSLVH